MEIAIALACHDVHATVAKLVQWTARQQRIEQHQVSRRT